jgi:LysR family transcriptional regulator, transcription activator of glutamate synthase operon
MEEPGSRVRRGGPIEDAAWRSGYEGADDVTFHDLEILLAFSANEHLGVTADRLGLSPASVQRAIRALETKLGVPLIERDGRRLRLKPSGWVLAEQAVRVLRSRSDAVDVVRAAAGLADVPLRVGHTFSLGIAVVPRIVARFMRARPTVRVMLRQGPATATVSSLLSGDVDAAFTSISPVEPDIRVLPLFTEAMLLAVPADDPLAARSEADLAELRERGFVAMRSGSSSRDHMMRACVRAGFTPRIVMETDDLFSVQGAVGAGIGLSVLPARMSDQAHPGVAMLPLREDVPTLRTICLAYRESTVRAASLHTLRHVAREHVALDPSLRQSQ